MTMLRNEKGFVLIVALIFLILLTAIGTASIFNATTEIKIAGNTKTASASLYIAEGGMEAVKAQLNRSAIDYFTIDGGSNISIITTGYTYITDTNTPSAKTLRDPCSWIRSSSSVTCNSDSTWMLGGKDLNGNFTTDATKVNLNVYTNMNSALTTANARWPIYRDFTIGDQTARVFIDTPQWSPSTPTKVTIPTQSQHINSNPMKKVVANMEIEFGNSLLIFQSFRATKAYPPGDTEAYRTTIPPDDTNTPAKVATGGIANTLSDSTKNWGTNTWQNFNVAITAGTGTGQTMRIFSNTAPTLTTDGNWTTVPDGTSNYKITQSIIIADPNNPLVLPANTPDNSRDYGIGGGYDDNGDGITDGTINDRITGIYTGDARVRIRKSTDGGNTWVNYALPRINSANSTFIIGGESAWAANTSYSTSSTPITSGNHVYQVITAGTSGGTAPAWPTGVGATVNDGTVVWQECGCMYTGFTLPLNNNERFKVDVVSTTSQEFLACYPP